MSAATETDYTLIGARHAWRVTRGVSPAGETVFEWRCPSCWQRYKDRRASVPDVAPSSAPRPPPKASSPSGQHAAVEAGKLFDKARDALAKPKSKRTR